MRVVIPVIIGLAVIAMIATFMWAAGRNRTTRSLERAEREGLLGAAGLRHAEQRADREWVENSRPAETLPVSDTVDHTIADAGRTGGTPPS
jgi:hypothetical protein